MQRLAMCMSVWRSALTANALSQLLTGFAWPQPVQRIKEHACAFSH